MNEPPESHSSAWSWGHETTEVHTRILRLALGVSESRAYWEHADPDVVGPERLETALEQRWFGDKSDARVRFLLSAMQERFDAFPNALGVLRGLSLKSTYPRPALDDVGRQLICHWHVQLADPIYRRFTGELLVGRRGTKKSAIQFKDVQGWVQSKYKGRWAESTSVQFASKLLAAASEAGLVTGKLDPRPLACPAVPDLALAYLLYLLRETRFKGTLRSNPYLASVGIEDVGPRLRAGLPGVTAKGDDLVWAAPNLAAWAEAFAG